MTRLASAASFALLLAAASSAFAQAVPETVYPPPEPTLSDDPRYEQTGFRFDLELRYLTDYVWRGIERFDNVHGEDAPNFQIEPRITLDLGKLPHPYVSVFFNTANDDQVSNLQEVRPEVGFDWDVRPLTISAGYTSYIFPDRDGIDTEEVFFRLQLDDSLLFHTERPIFTPYAFGAYDFDQFDGVYLELGVEHELPVENTGLSFLVNAQVAYVNGFDLFSRTGEDNSGFQHYQIGLTAKYRLNELLNIPDRFGKVSILGFINYTDELSDKLEATNQIWGGVGLSLAF